MKPGERYYNNLNSNLGLYATSGTGCYYKDPEGNEIGYHDCFTCPYPDCIIDEIDVLRRFHSKIPKRLLELQERTMGGMTANANSKY